MLRPQCAEALIPVVAKFLNDRCLFIPKSSCKLLELFIIIGFLAS